MKKCLIFIFAMMSSIHAQYDAGSLMGDYGYGRDTVIDASVLRDIQNYTEDFDFADFRDVRVNVRDLELGNITRLGDYPIIGFPNIDPEEPKPICPTVPIPFNPRNPFGIPTQLKYRGSVLGKCIDGERTVTLSCDVDKCPPRFTVKIPCGNRGDYVEVNFEKTNKSIMEKNQIWVNGTINTAKESGMLAHYLDLTPDIFKLLDNVGKKKVETKLEDFKRYVSLECEGRDFNKETLNEEQESQLNLLKKFCQFASKIDHFNKYETIMDKLVKKFGGDITLMDIRALKSLYTPSDDSDLELKKQQALQLLSVRWLYMNVMMQNTASEFFPLFKTWYRGTGLWFGMTSTPMMNSFFNSDEYNSKVLGFVEAMKCPKKNKVCELYKDLARHALREAVKKASIYEYRTENTIPVDWGEWSRYVKKMDAPTISEVETILETGKCMEAGCKADMVAVHAIREIEELDAMYKKLNFVESNEIYKEILKDENLMSLEQIEELVDGLILPKHSVSSLDKAKKSWLLLTEARGYLLNHSLENAQLLILKHFPEMGKKISSTCQKIKLHEGLSHVSSNFIQYCEREMSNRFVDTLWDNAAKKHPTVLTFKNTFQTNLYNYLRTVKREIVK